jgi:hypothetical protein
VIAAGSASGVAGGEAGSLDAMKRSLAALLGLAAFITSAVAADLDTAKIDQLTGLKGKLNEKEGVYKISFPRQRRERCSRWLEAPAFYGSRDLGLVSRD